METPPIVSRDEWLTARKELLAKEKEATRARDAVAAQRRALPMVEVDKDYVFEGPDGKARLIDLFEGRRQLMTYHFMWMHDSDVGCTSCSFLVDNVGDVRHLNSADTTLALVSRAPIASIERFRQRMGWTLPFYSSRDNDFNYDFHVTADEDIVAPSQYNYMDKATLEAKGIGFFVGKGQDAHGLSVFLRDGNRVFHTYSTYGRGPDLLLTTYNYLDLTPLGRQRYVNEFPHHDTYEAGAPAEHCH
ncbi:DUF899 domain-containing protein [Sphaerisporangium album]|uniref:DUF899 domain-containing protein n=1 Tax=Sphaerisporangium album TaxID=509200 RepID=A0A367FRZ2_9ACTN|nr:DUF899 domain-containing protein [Sphaerisporangium album]RCG33186.1 DUF899 domain-containing protein [Sphaerisporangium album]